MKHRHPRPDRSPPPGATATPPPTAASCASWRGAGTTCCSSSATCRGTPRNRDLPRPPYGTHRAVREPRRPASRASRAEVRNADARHRRLVRARGRRGRRLGCSNRARASPPSTTSTRRSRSPSSRGGTASTSRPRLIPRYDLYLSFTGGPTLDAARDASTARRGRCRSTARVDPDALLSATDRRHALGPRLPRHLQRRSPAGARAAAARAGPALAGEGRFVVAGPQYPADIAWPANVERIEHLAPGAAPRASTTASASRSTSPAPT